jgi:hypothetical protein
MHAAKGRISSRAPAILLALLFACGALYADDFWKNKPPSEWTLKQTMKLLEDSPWSRQEVRVVARNGAGPDAAVDNNKYHCDSDRLDAAGNCLSPRVVFPGDSSRSPEVEINMENQVIFLVRWESSAVVEEAFARLSDLGERATAQYLSAPPRLPADRYVVTLKALDKAGPVGHARGAMPLNPIGTLESDASGPRARLTVGNVVVPAAESVRSAVGSAAEAAHFFFPREVHGAPLVPAGHAARVTFEFRGQRFSVKTHFDIDAQTPR